MGGQIGGVWGGGDGCRGPLEGLERGANVLDAEEHLSSKLVAVANQNHHGVDDLTHLRSHPDDLVEKQVASALAQRLGPNAIQRSEHSLATRCKSRRRLRDRMGEQRIELLQLENQHAGAYFAFPKLEDPAAEQRVADDHIIQVKSPREALGHEGGRLAYRAGGELHERCENLGQLVEERRAVQPLGRKVDPSSFRPIVDDHGLAFTKELAKQKTLELSNTGHRSPVTVQGQSTLRTSFPGQNWSADERAHPGASALQASCAWKETPRSRPA